MVGGGQKKKLGSQIQEPIVFLPSADVWNSIFLFEKQFPSHLCMFQMISASWGSW